jgi:hypothetical protein
LTDVPHLPTLRNLPTDPNEAGKHAKLEQIEPPPVHPDRPRGRARPRRTAQLRRRIQRCARRADHRRPGAGTSPDFQLRRQEWQDHFATLGNDAILCDKRRVLHYRGEDGFYRIYPTSVPLSDELTRRGRTEIISKRPAPEWRPTPNMLERNPDLPRYVGPARRIRSESAP